MPIKWDRVGNGIDGVSYTNTDHFSASAEEYVACRGKWGAQVMLNDTVLRVGHRLSEAFNSREEAEAAAIALLVKHISDLADVVGYKVVKDEA